MHCNVQILPHLQRLLILHLTYNTVLPAALSTLSQSGAYRNSSTLECLLYNLAYATLWLVLQCTVAQVTVGQPRFYMHVSPALQYAQDVQTSKLAGLPPQRSKVIPSLADSGDAAKKSHAGGSAAATAATAPLYATADAASPRQQPACSTAARLADSKCTVAGNSMSIAAQSGSAAVTNAAVDCRQRAVRQCL